MVAHPASVPAARRMVESALTSWGRAELVDDVALSVTELVTNATLHSGGDDFELELAAEQHGVRVAVTDSGGTSAEAIAAQASVLPQTLVDLSDDDVLDIDLSSMTGRGLYIVSTLASNWGIEDAPNGTRLWAEFVGGGQAQAWQPPKLVTPDFEHVTSPVAPAVVIELLDCPAHLVLEHEKHLNDVAREMSLLTGSDGGSAVPGLTDSVAEVANTARVAAVAWSGIRILAAAARREGKDVIDVELPVREPEDLARKAAAVDTILAQADELAEQGVLMSMPSSEELRTWRAWLTDEMTQQVATGRRPVPFSQFAETTARSA